MYCQSFCRENWGISSIKICRSWQLLYEYFLGKTAEMIQRSFCMHKRAVKVTGEKHAGEAAVRVRRFAPFPLRWRGWCEAGMYAIGRRKNRHIILKI